jgi:hypothetical protein
MEHNEPTPLMYTHKNVSARQVVSSQQGKARTFRATLTLNKFSSDPIAMDFLQQSLTHAIYFLYREAI